PAVSAAWNRAWLVARLVGWVERRETHRCVRRPGTSAMGFAKRSTHPTGYGRILSANGQASKPAAVQESLARVVVAREVAAKPDIFGVAGMDAADDGDLVVARALIGGDVAIKVFDVRRPLDDPPGVVAGQPGADGIGVRREREGKDGGGKHPAHW